MDDPYLFDDPLMHRPLPLFDVRIPPEMTSADVAARDEHQMLLKRAQDERSTQRKERRSTRPDEVEHSSFADERSPSHDDPPQPIEEGATTTPEVCIVYDECGIAESVHQSRPLVQSSNADLDVVRSHVLYTGRVHMCLFYGSDDSLIVKAWHRCASLLPNCTLLHMRTPSQWVPVFPCAVVFNLYGQCAVFDQGWLYDLVTRGRLPFLYVYAIAHSGEYASSATDDGGGRVHVLVDEPDALMQTLHEFRLGDRLHRPNHTELAARA